MFSLRRFFSFGPCTARRRGEIHSTPSPPPARTPLRSFAPPLPTKSADFVGAPVAFWRNQKEKMGGKRRSAACGGCSKPLSRMRHDWRPRQGPGIVPPRRCCNEPASILAGIPPPVRAGTDFPLREKAKSSYRRTPPFPCGEKSNPPSEREPIPRSGKQKGPPDGEPFAELAEANAYSVFAWSTTFLMAAPASSGSLLKPPSSVSRF